MKLLTLIRHAKSSRDNPRQQDRFRPLNARGFRDAPAMGRYLDATFRFSPDSIVSSPAIRAITTAKLVAETVGFSDWRIHQDERIYEAPVSSLVDVIHDQPNSHDHVCLVGHNPGMENLANWLCGSRVVTEVVTCAVIMLELNITSWDRAEMACGRLREYICPELIGLEKDDV